MTKAGIVGVVLAFGAGYLVAVEIFRKGLRMGARLAAADMRCSKCGNEDGGCVGCVIRGAVGSLPGTVSANIDGGHTRLYHLFLGIFDTFCT